MVTDTTKKLISHIGLLAVLIFISLYVSQTIGLFRTGFESQEVLTQWFFYVGPAGIGLLLIVILFFAETMINKGDTMYGNSVAFDSPEEAPAILGKSWRNHFKLFLACLILFSIVMLFATTRYNTYFTGVGTLKAQQFQVLDSVLFSAALVPIAENAGVAALLAIFLFYLRARARRSNMSSLNYKGLAILGAVVIFFVYGLFNHWLRYSNVEISLYYVMFFWVIGGLLTILSGSFIPFWVLHLTNNLFFDLNKTFSNEAIYLYTIGSLIVLSIIFAILFLRKKEAPTLG